jgi:hypothetical protein
MSDRCQRGRDGKPCGYVLIHGLCPVCEDVTPGMFISPAYYGAWMRGEPMKAQGRTRIQQKHREMIYRRDRYRCVHCESKERLTIGHIIPVIFGGANTPANYRTECSTCNSKEFTADMRADTRRYA